MEFYGSDSAVYDRGMDGFIPMGIGIIYAG
jgi:hypothetical protein